MFFYRKILLYYLFIAIIIAIGSTFLKEISYFMLGRKIINDLNSWKSRPHKSLIISGARQVGKTFSVREFSKNYDSYIYAV